MRTSSRSGINWEVRALMYRATDPASLGVVRALFGLCMVLDVVEERGLAVVDLKWGDPELCHFPLIHGLRPLPLPWIIILYGIMWLGAFGIMLGLYFKWACAVFAIPYWYIFILDKSFWNNHSYLYGIVALLFWGTGANRYLALDSILNRRGERSVPFWNYFILRFQLFVMYFIAGLKKSSREWLEGYAMTNLSKHWVFYPFKLILTTEQTDLYVVHWFGFGFDLTIGFLMLFTRTRATAMLLCATFHLMNSQLFKIGMFPYVCLATMPLFCRPDWPRKLTGRFRPRKDVDSDSKRAAAGTEPRTRARLCPSATRGLVLGILLIHVLLQLSLPYSHFVTKGYNNWVPGLYGYSWDMMVHAWDTVLVVIKVRDNESQKDYFLDPGVWVSNDRWTKHGDMARQYAFCIKDNLEKLKKRNGKLKGPWRDFSSNLSIYVDVWCSLNGRFQQRLFDPLVDMLQVEWHPLQPISYLMPLLHQFNSYRVELDRIQRHVLSWSNYTDVLFVADFPGMELENYIEPGLGNVSLSVLEGEIAYAEETTYAEEGCGRTIGKGGSVRIETGRFHKVETTSPHPACYMYTFTNRTKQQLTIRGEKETGRAEKSFSPLMEIGYKIDAFSRAIGHIVNALLHLTCDVPMIRRISLD